jgi:7-carboxy-7-deazaguanine synthase
MPLILAATTPGKPEIFASLQGEGPSAGRPSTFIRLSHCILACVWCDTAYTWRFTGDNHVHRDTITFDRKANQVTLSEPEAAARIAALAPRRLVITGGEPLLQAAALARMIPLLPPQKLSWHIEVETNGTIAPPPALDALINQYNVSPKLAHSGNPAGLALIPERIAAWSRDPRACFKFVIAAPGDLAEVLTLQGAHSIPAARIWLMPEGRDAQTLRERSPWLARICLEHEFNFSDRLHIHLYGDTRGA